MKWTCTMDMVNFCAFLLDLWLVIGLWLVLGLRLGYVRLPLCRHVACVIITYTAAVQGGIWGRSQWGELRQVVSHTLPFPLPPLPLSIPRTFSDKPVGGKVRSSDGEVPRLTPYIYRLASVFPRDQQRPVLKGRSQRRSLSIFYNLLHVRTQYDKQQPKFA